MSDITSLLDSKEQDRIEDELFRVVATGEKFHEFSEKTDGFEAHIKFKLPSLKQRDTADALYAKAYNKLLQDDDYLTTKELLERAKKRGLWSDADESRLMSLDQLIVDAKQEAKEEKNAKRQKKLLEDLSSYRSEKFQLAMKLMQLTSTAVEHVAERPRTTYMLVNCVFIVDDAGIETPLYSSKEQVEQEKDLKKLEKILLEGRSFWSGEGLSDFLHLGD